MTSPWVDGEALNSAKMYARVTAPIASLQTQVQANSRIMVVQRNTTSSIPNSMVTPVTSWGLGVVYAPAANDITYAAGLFTVPAAGLYQWDGSISPAGGASTYSVSMNVYQNGSVPTSNSGRQSNTGNVTPWSSGGPLIMAAGDTLGLVLYQNSGSALVVSPLQFSLYQIG